MQWIVTQLLGNNKLPNSPHLKTYTVYLSLSLVTSNMLAQIRYTDTLFPILPKIAFTYPNSLCVLVPTKNHAAAHYRKQQQTVNTNVSTPGTLYR